MFHRRGSGALPAGAWASLGLVAGLFCGVAAAATPPPTLNYQGVLRNASNVAVSGAFEMFFRFFDAPTGGNEILVDAHLFGSNPVIVTGGVFDTVLGREVVLDGSGPGTYTSLAQVFRDFNEVWMQIQVNGEMMEPRVRIQASAYALNASNLEGRPASEFLDVSTAAQFKNGPLAAVSSAPGTTGVTGGGTDTGGVFFDTDGTGFAYVGAGNTGVQAQGEPAGRFDENGGYSWAQIASGSVGVLASGTSGGGYFQDQNGFGSATLASGGVGVDASGASAGAHFITSGLSGEAWLGYGDRGIEAKGSDAAGYFKETDSQAEVWIANLNYGIQARGASGAGLFFEDGNNSYAYLGRSGRGVEAAGSVSGGYFSDLTQSGFSSLGFGDRGIEAGGNEMGGYFYDKNESGWAKLGFGASGIQAQGATLGGYFADTDGNPSAYLAYQGQGVYALGTVRGGRFLDLDNTGEANIAEGDRGIWAKGIFAGGTFSDPDDVTFWADVATPTHKIFGPGTVSFVQNHPVEKNRTIVYAAPEGDETAVYTRGTARLVNGEARVRLGETFAFVANPDLGLTAHLTPRGEPVPLAVVSLTTEEMVVEGPAGQNGGLVFDYMVWGLRIGFEDLPIVRPKTREAFLPAAEDVQAGYGEEPGLNRLSARARYERMRAEAGLPAPGGPPRAAALAAAINEGRELAIAEGNRRAEAEREQMRAASAAVASPREGRSEGTEAAAAPTPVPATPITSPLVTVGGPGEAQDSASYHVLPVSGSVQPGDVLVLDPDVPGALRASSAPRETTVAGCAATPEEGVDLPYGHSPVAVSGVVLCRVDAAYGPVRIGDLLTTAPTPAHAMRAGGDATGAILGKAMEPLDAGSGLVRVLISLR